MGKTFKDKPTFRKERAPKEDRRKERGGHTNLLRTAMEEWEENREPDKTSD